jgi:hypothetical protein
MSLEHVGTETRWMMWAQRVQRTGLVLAGILISVLPAAAQMEIGDNWRLNLNGNVGYNYMGNMNDGVSAHSMGFNGNANLSGSFYNPNFINFNVQPYYDRNQNNSVYGSLTNSSGVSANVNLFSGSHFPGSVSYGKGLDDSGQFGIPASQIGLAQHGNSQNFGLTWSELLPNMPTLTASYLVNSGTSSLFGSQQQSDQTNHTLSLLSTYSVAGFRLSGGYTHRNIDAQYSHLLDGAPEPVETINANDTLQVTAQHSFPLNGSFTLGASRSTYGYDYHDSYDTKNSGTFDALSGTLVFRPQRKLTVGSNVNYNESLFGNVPESLVNGGTAVNTTSLGSFKSVLLGSNAYYQLVSSLTLQGTVTHIRQEFLGTTYSSTQFGGGANYNLNRRFLGSLSLSFAAYDSASQEGNQGLGFTGNLNFERKIDGWDITGNFSYSQNVQTLILIYTNSSYGWVSNVNRRLGNRLYFSAGYGGSHSGLSSVAGSSSSSERWSGALNFRSYNVNGFYSKSDGAAIFTPTGLVAIPSGLPPGLFEPDAVITYGSKAYGFNGGGVFMRRLTCSVGYAESHGSTVDPLMSTYTSTQLYNGIMQYRMRKIYLNAGVTRLRQGVGVAGTPPVTVMSYYIGFSRWFNFF